MKLTMRLGQKSYDIIIKRGALSNIGSLGNLQRKILVITDSNVPSEYAQSVLSQCKEGYCLRLAAGEDTKSFASLEQICSELLKYNFSRKDAIVALGGGVIGDLAGFAASSYMRGISFINIPTTTLSQIDSSIGGKTAINLQGTKNIVGAFYQPELVVIDPDTLNTLAPRHYINGLAEAIKAGFIADEKLLQIFEAQTPHEAIEEILYRSLIVKKEVVERDERENGLRAILNFGHTIGHAIESVNGLSELYHGECIALGMLPMLKGEKLKKRARSILKKLGLPHKIKYNNNEIYEFITHDKKADGAEITIVMVEKVGHALLKKIPIEQMHKLIGDKI